jgi:hypothetical protein
VSGREPGQVGVRSRDTDSPHATCPCLSGASLSACRDDPNKSGQVGGGCRVR